MVSVLEWSPCWHGRLLRASHLCAKISLSSWKDYKLMPHSLPTQSSPHSLWESGVSKECRVKLPGSIPLRKLFHRELIPVSDISCHVRFKSLHLLSCNERGKAGTRQWTCTTCEHFGFWVVSDRSSSLCRETSSSGCQHQPMGRVCYCSAPLFTGAIAPLALTPAAVGHVFPLALVGSKYTPGWSHQWNQLSP